MAPTPTDADPRGLCIACNYPLCGLNEHRCPECGHAFDPANPWTMNMGRPLSPASRWLLTPTGWPLLIAALSSLAVLLYLTDTRSLTLRPSTVELQTCLLGPKALARAFATWPAPQKVFFGATALSAAASTVGVSRVLMRWLIAIARRQWRYRPRDLWHKAAITFTALSACLILIFHGYPLRIARTWVIQQLAAPGAALVPAPAPMSRQQRLLVLDRGMLYLDTPRQRTAAMAMLIRHDPAAAPAVLEQSLARERDPVLIATLPHPPDGHALRVTEWAVWRSAAGHWPEAPTPAQDPAPAFIHGRHLRLGARRPDAAAKLEKSVIFLSASQPLAVDVEVQFAFGQPYLAYPRPDEAAMVPQSRGRSTEPAPADLAAAPDLYEGYPWLAPDQPGGESFATSQQYTADAVIPFFKRLLTDRGLSDAETQTILDLWADEFFAREGRRVLTLLSGDDYHSVYPIHITPAPTSLHRVGVIITELPPS